MNQDKIGKFIAKLRKEKNMTQSELAEKIGVSINAVSKWERGLNFPDVSLYKKICDELNVSIEELINGEKNPKQLSIENKTIVSKKKTKKILTILAAILFITLILTVFYNLKLKINLVNDFDYLYEETLNFIKEKEFAENPDSKYKDFNVFYSYHGFGIEKNNNYKYVYMWLFDKSFYIEDDEYGGALAVSSGSSMPLKAVFKDNNLQTIVYPKDGNEYVSSIKEMFPGIIRYQVLNFDKEKNINKLSNEVENKKNIYYNYLSLDMAKLTMEDLEYNNLIFSIEYRNNKCNVPVKLNILKNNKYSLNTEYRSCKKDQVCTSILQYTSSIEGNYEFDIMEIVRHSVDANNYQYNDDSSLEYVIYSGKGHEFITDRNNRYLTEFIDSIGVDLKQCAKPSYDD